MKALDTDTNSNPHPKESPMSNPLPVGTEYDGHKIVEVVDTDPNDDYQPYLYQLDNGEQVWIPVDADS